MKDQQKELSIKTVPVEIRVLMVDGKRMTKSVFDQITEGDGYVYVFKNGAFVEQVNVLGWVKVMPKARGGESRKWLIYSRDGALYKCIERNVKRFSVRDLLCDDLSPQQAVDRIETAGRTGLHDQTFVKWESEPARWLQSPDMYSIIEKRPWDNQESYDKAVLRSLEEFKLLPAARKRYYDLLPEYEKISPSFDAIFSVENQIFISI